MTGDDVVCSPITLTQNGVTSDPSGLADLSTLKHHGMWVWVKVKFAEITDLQLVRPVGGSSCTDLTYQGKPAPGYGLHEGGIWIDLGCQAELSVCGKRKFEYSKLKGVIYSASSIKLLLNLDDISNSFIQIFTRRWS